MSMIDMFWIAVVIVFFAVIVLVGIYLFDSIMPMVTDMFGAGDATNVVNTVRGGYKVMDYIFLFLFFSLSTIPIVFAFLVPSHPIFFVINIMLLIAFFFVAPALSNFMHDFFVVDEFAQYSAGGGASYTFPIMTRVFQYMPILTSGISIILMVVLFAKSRGEETGV